MTGWTVYRDDDASFGVCEDGADDLAPAEVIRSGISLEQAFDIAERLNTDELVDAEYPHA